MVIVLVAFLLTMNMYLAIEDGGATKYLFKVKNKDTKTIPMVVFLVLFCLL